MTSNTGKGMVVVPANHSQTVERLRGMLQAKSVTLVRAG
jgi:hypothetical protein